MRTEHRSVFFFLLKCFVWMLWTFAFVRVRMIPNTVPLAVGGIFPVTVEVWPKPYHNYVLTLRSSDPTVATVSEKIVGKAGCSSLKGTIAAQGIGNTTITVAINPGNRLGLGGQRFVKKIMTLFGLGIGQSQCTVGHSPVFIVAPHPDDEALMTSGVIARAIDDGQLVKVAIVTNGDHREADVAYGLSRQVESVNAMRTLGLRESDLLFLGYPGDVVGLLQMMNNYLTPDAAYTSTAGVRATYGAYGLGNCDFHSWLTGKPGLYNAPNLMNDLVTLIQAWRPLHIYATSRFDEHPDHRAVYYFIVRAVQYARLIDPSYVPTLHTTIIHDITDEPYTDFWEHGSSLPVRTVNFSGDDHWPRPARSSTDPERVRFDASIYFNAPPNLMRTSLRWTAVESVPVPPAMAVAVAEDNLKYQVLANYRSQQLAYLAPFCKRDEIFWTEQPAASEMLLFPPLPLSVRKGKAAVLAVSFVRPVESPRAVALASSDDRIVSVPPAVIVATGTVTALFAVKGETPGTAAVSAYWDTAHVIANITVMDSDKHVESEGALNI